ncbi:GNAT family N-acetyltransferase [Burkholderia sp. WAC0059]|uniref:GNAT family N-acetyltransferase n=1 Tax=Burkholderia sp. WAC0059 TaxID=2066022 RepID=UPI000C7F315C|nr:GNAT family N-acetyltransferase [Burkholderia sp. WAC0059]PLZ03144.1 GNAT family N-acetyltransferase [Burkholderia sp. WAC0059]
MNTSPLRIEPFSAPHGDGVVDLILPIQQAEFGVPITLADQPDLLDIPGFYRQGSGNFWIALDEGTVVGSIALLDIGDGRAALRKMFVADSHRGAGSGVARRLLQTLIEWCREHGIREIYLGTTEKFLAAHRFYEKHGFLQIEKHALPATFPIVHVDTRFYALRLA